MQPATIDERNITASIEACLKGDTDAFGVIVRAFQQPLHRYGVHFGLRSEDAEDAAVDILIKVFRSLARFDTARGFRPWLFRIAHNHLIELIRSRSRRRRFLNETTRCETERQTSPPPEERFEMHRSARRLQRLLAAVPPKYRDVLVLKYYHGLSYRDIAAVTGLKENTVASHLLRAKKRLREEMIKEDADEMSF